ncbi:MAG: FGGY-family carbohydrate kinase [Tepidisphaeraceae bacterium]
MPDYVLAIDFGTSYFKTALLDDHGRLCGIERVPTPITRHGERSEIDPETFKRVIRESIKALGRQNPGVLKRVRAISYCTQANTFTLLGANGKPLTPLIVWDDQRAQAVADRLPWANQDEPELAAHRSLTGIPRLSAGFAIAKLHWLRLREPDVIAATRKLVFIGDYFTQWLTGRHVTDGSVAAMSGLFDVEGWRWSEHWCDRLGVDPVWLPQVERAGTLLSPILPLAADELGLPRECCFVVGLLDQYAGAIGVGNTTPGDVSETTGTVLATIRASTRFSPLTSSPSTSATTLMPRFSGPGVQPGSYYHMAFGDVSAFLLEYFRQQLPDRPDFSTLDAIVTPRTPRLTLDHHLPSERLREQLRHWAIEQQPRGAVVMAIYEAVARALAEQVAALVDGDSLPPVIRSAGGASRSRRWLQIKADTLGIPVRAPSHPEPTLLGVLSLIAPAMNWDAVPTEPEDRSDWLMPSAVKA